MRLILSRRRVKVREIAMNDSDIKQKEREREGERRKREREREMRKKERENGAPTSDADERFH